jgi:hypothetical protein
LEQLFAGQRINIPEMLQRLEQLLWLRGGFPDSYLDRDKDRSHS